MNKSFVSVSANFEFCVSFVSVSANFENIFMHTSAAHLIILPFKLTLHTYREDKKVAAFNLEECNP